MSADDEQPDHTEDPRKQETGSGGYPESTQGGTEGQRSGKPDEGDHTEDAPSPSTEEESDRDASTGNPDAAG
jgi:hypothetical protein